MKEVLTKRGPVKKLGATLSKALQRVILLIESRRTTYQPVPALGITSSKRAESSYGRWRAIQADLTSMTGSMLDIGCNVGFFAHQFAESGYLSFGIEGDPENVYVANLARQAGKIEGFSVMQKYLDPENISDLPTVDVITFFSVWHHWIGVYGLDGARDMLSELWNKTRRTMYFEGGEDTEVDLLGIERPAAEWIKDELQNICTGGVVCEIGKFDSGTHKELGYRTLFAVGRV